MTQREAAPSGDRRPNTRPPSRAQDDRHFLHRHGKRILVFLGGLVLIAGGGIMLVTPGPGWLAILAGLALWATEFEWAERRLERTRKRLERAAQRAGVDPKQAAIGGILVVVILSLGGTVLWLVLT